MPTVLITGASRGIGRGFAQHYEAAGWRVVATCRDPGRAGLNGEAYALDVTRDDSIAALKAQLAGAPIDLLINNAGITHREGSRIGALDYDGWTDVLAVNALAPIRVAEALADNVAASERKTMVFITSMMGSIARTGSGDSIIYRSSKACLNAAVNVLGNGLRSRGIGCVLFHPGWVRTDMGGPSASIDVATGVRGMTGVIEGLTPRDSGRFLNYDGTEIPW